MFAPTAIPTRPLFLASYVLCCWDTGIFTCSSLSLLRPECEAWLCTWLVV